MSTKENRSIAYIYNEMDPSEKVEFERDLESNSDLLIEVESLKQISKNLNELEQINPPDHVVQAVYDSVRKSSNHSINNWRTFFYSAAAVLLIGMTTGIFLIDDQQTEANDDERESASVSMTPIFSQPVSTSSSESVAPWVDKNEILYLQGQAGSGNQAAIDSIKNDSFKKLTPMTDPLLMNPHKRLQLTGNRN